jgi:hypothetical protein
MPKWSIPSAIAIEASLVAGELHDACSAGNLNFGSIMSQKSLWRRGDRGEQAAEC